MPRPTERSYQLNSKAMSAARVPLDAPLALSRSAWGSTFTAAPSPPETASAPSKQGGAIAVVSICGPLAQEADELCGWYDGYGGATGITARVVSALSDSNIVGVVLRFDSPGGTSAGVEECIRRISEAREASKKPILAVVDEQCCSAAYWLGSTIAVDGIYAPRAAFTGSIGAYCMHVDESGKLAEEGLVTTIIADPPGKTAGFQTTPLSDLGQRRIERMVQDVTARFFAAVSASRNITTDAIRALDGEVRGTEAAIEAGLLDGIGSLEDVISLAASMAGAGGTLPATITNSPGEETPPPEDEEDSMPISARARSILGVAPGLTDAAMEDHLLQLAGLGRHVMALAEAPSPDAARGVVEARFRDAADVPRLREQLATAAAAAEESTRTTLVEAGVREGKITPAMAFTFGVDAEGKKTRALSAWASAPHKNAAGEDVGQSLAQLRAYLASAAPVAGISSERARAVKDPGQSDDAGDASKAARAGLPLEVYRAGKALVTAAEAAA